MNLFRNILPVLLAAVVFGGMTLVACAQSKGKSDTKSDSANTGVVAYFLCAVAAHLRARFLASAFWVNCLGYLAVSTTILILSLVLPA